MRIGILNSGGDCPGLNAVIHGVVGAAHELGWETIGFLKGAGNSHSSLQYLMIDTDLPHDGLYMYRLRQQDFDGTTSYSPEVQVEFTLRPHAFGLRQNYPNPVMGRTTVPYAIEEGTEVTIELYDTLGRGVTTLISDRQPAGRYSISVETSNLASGLYLYRMEAGDKTFTRTLTVVR